MTPARHSVTLLLACAFACAGCETVEKRQGGPERVVEDGPRPDRREEALLEALEEEPEKLETWYLLAQHYEQGLRFVEAYAAYARFQKELDAVEKRQKLEMPRRSTLGLWHLGTLALRMGDGNLAFKHFVELLDRRPEKVEQARVNPHFQDAHFQLAQLYYRVGRDEEAKLHVMIHRELGGTRGDGILVGLERRKRKAEKGEAAQSVDAGAPRGEGEAARPAGAGRKE